MASAAAFLTTRYDEGIAWARCGKGNNPDHPGVLRVLAANCGQIGRIEEGRAAVAELKRGATEMRIESNRTQMPFENPADLERCLEGLRKAGLPES
jgi:hypothetical protein